jgi:hypothetical protein
MMRPRRVDLRRLTFVTAFGFAVSVTAVLAIGSSPALSVASSVSLAQRTVVDRTFVCTTTRVVVDGYPDPFVSQGVTVGISRPHDSLYGPPQGGSVSVSDKNGGDFVSARNGPIGANKGVGVFYEPAQCSWKRTVRASLSRKGLRTRPVRTEGQFECDLPRRILVRIRTVVTPPAKWKLRDGTMTVISRRMSMVQLVVRTTSGKPVAYAELFPKGVALYLPRGRPACEKT